MQRRAPYQQLWSRPSQAESAAVPSMMARRKVSQSVSLAPYPAVPNPAALQPVASPQPAAADSRFMAFERVFTRRGEIAVGALRLGDDILTWKGYRPLRGLEPLADTPAALSLTTRGTGTVNFYGHPQKLICLGGWPVMLLTGLSQALANLASLAPRLTAGAPQAAGPHGSAPMAAQAQILAMPRPDGLTLAHAGTRHSASTGDLSVKLVFDCETLVFTPQGIFGSAFAQDLPPGLTAPEEFSLLCNFYRVDV